MSQITDILFRVKFDKGLLGLTTDEAEQAINDLLNNAINEAESLWHYEDGIEVAQAMAREIRRKLGLTTKEDK